MTLYLSRRQALAGSLLAIPTLAAFARQGRAGDGGGDLDRIVAEAIRPVMKEHDVPGMAVAITIKGKRRFYNFGVASKASGQKVSEDTLFEIGSISKTFTATLGAYAQAKGALSLSDMASNYLPALAGTVFDQISLLDLATYTAGGLPLQFPDDVTDHDKLIAYFRSWRPEFPAGSYRRYSNPSIGLFGHLAARSLNVPFDVVMQGDIFPALGLTRSYIKVPQDQIGNYAYGYSKSGEAVRVTPGVFDSEAYGVKTTAADMLRFLEANIDSSGLDDTSRRAIAATHIGYYKVGPMTQGLGWESYPFPVGLERLLDGNSTDMARKANAAEKLDPPVPASDDTLINKTGSTRGFGAYAAFIPTKSIGIALLANKAYPIPARVTAAHRILTALK
ncbi:beta-lactamase [Nordella sp. HKS 07]|uniref:class C beta-lactamase n=1 Tax=Nordella sp. HKS 07 TaxID=2712222 RepID=UPI0013E11DA5|nr:class C beta-lactamase [Nordella sp. HKS 07]QIG48719.1 beta-lactamase [Nordella sp. HKS 07]